MRILNRRKWKRRKAAGEFLVISVFSCSDVFIPSSGRGESRPGQFEAQVVAAEGFARFRMNFRFALTNLPEGLLYLSDEGSRIELREEPPAFGSGTVWREQTGQPAFHRHVFQAVQLGELSSRPIRPRLKPRQ